MCLAVYIASDKPLPIVPWEERRPSFHVHDLTKDPDDEAVRQQFEMAHVHYMGSDEGCGCGFLKEWKEAKDLELVEKNYSELADYVRGALDGGAKVQMFSCWGGDESSEREFHETIIVDDLLQPDFQFKEKAFYEVNRQYS
jgi:hypothetical protein